MRQNDIRVLVADDHPIVRAGTCALLTNYNGICLVGEASNGREAIEQVEILDPDVVLMDIMMPVMDGIEATRYLTAHFANVRILVLTSFDDDDKVFPALKAGALGYILKDTIPENLARAISQVYRGELFLHPDIARQVFQGLRQTNEPTAPVERLTERELEVLSLVAKGLGDEEIANHLIIAEVTVRTHISNILAKLHLENRVQAALFALREGLSTLPDGPIGTLKLYD